MSDHHDDELRRRFRAVFNKEPVSQVAEDPACRVDTQCEYEVDDEELGRLIEESAALNEPDVKELVKFSTTTLRDSIPSKPEVDDLLERAKLVTQESNKLEDGLNEISEDDISALLKQLSDEHKDLKTLGSHSRSQEAALANDAGQNFTDLDDSAEVAALLSQLTDAARLEQNFEDHDPESSFASDSKLSLPSVPKDADDTVDELSNRLAKLKSFQPKNYTGTDRGSINVFVPGLSKTEDDETVHWCGICCDDATIECLGCEGDLYCDNCFREGHNQPDTKTHLWKRYRRKAQAF